jgi:hypothetical protein
MSDDIYSRTPINGQAARITSGGSEEEDYSNDDYKREHLIEKISKLHGQIILLNKNDPLRRDLGFERFNCQEELRAIPKIMVHESFQGMIVTVAKEKVSSFLWRQIIADAKTRFESENN